MVKLKDIVHNVIVGNHKQLSTPSSSQPTASTSLATEISRKFSYVGVEKLGIVGDKQSEFAEQAAAMVTDDKFLDEFQESIGKPKEDESEEEFVYRAKNKMRDLLKSKLK